jgi:hypothetical protein
MHVLVGLKVCYDLGARRARDLEVRKYCHVQGIRMTKIMGSGSDDWIYWCFFTIALIHNQ